MSRHEITARNPAHKVIVGWDHPLQTFFLQVIDRAKEKAGLDKKFVKWVGCRPREIYEVGDLRQRLRAFADLSMEMAVKLYSDKDEGR